MESSLLQNDNQIVKYVSKTAQVGKNVKIWHFAYVGDKTIIGDNVMIGSLAQIIMLKLEIILGLRALFIFHH